jgi:hypothetical protein
MGNRPETRPGGFFFTGRKEFYRKKVETIKSMKAPAVRIGL